MVDPQEEKATVTIYFEQYRNLVISRYWLTCLEQAGVDNMPVYDDALEIWAEEYGEDEDEF